MTYNPETLRYISNNTLSEMIAAAPTSSRFASTVRLNVSFVTAEARARIAAGNVDGLCFATCQRAGLEA